MLDCTKLKLKLSIRTELEKFIISMCNINENHTKKISIVVIDSGIESSISNLSNFIIKSTGYGVNSEGYISEFPEIKPSSMHGTSIALVIRSICSDIQLISINILNKRMSTDSRIMIYAMNEAIELEPDIIHMSLGTNKWKYKSYIKQIVKKAIEKNIIIVSASSNFGLWSYPASINGVVGVKSATNRSFTKNLFYYSKGYYHAPSNMHGIEGTEGLNINRMNGSSIAAAYITGLIAKIKYQEELNNYHDIINSLNSKIYTI